MPSWQPFTYLTRGVFAASWLHFGKCRTTCPKPGPHSPALREEDSTWLLDAFGVGCFSQQVALQCVSALAPALQLSAWLYKTKAKQNKLLLQKPLASSPSPRPPAPFPFAPPERTTRPSPFGPHIRPGAGPAEAAPTPTKPSTAGQRGPSSWAPVGRWTALRVEVLAFTC